MLCLKKYGYYGATDVTFLPFNQKTLLDILQFSLLSCPFHHHVNISYFIIFLSGCVMDKKIWFLAFLFN